MPSIEAHWNGRARLQAKHLSNPPAVQRHFFPALSEKNIHTTVQLLPACKLKISQLFSEAAGSNHISQPILYCMQWDSSPVTLATKEMEEKVALACVRRSRALSDRNHNRDRKAHLQKQIGRTLNVAAEFCAFITSTAVAAVVLLG